MNLSQLYYFKKLAELQHYTNAAKELFISQPALSDAIKSLERELNVPLFQREGRNVKLTKYGHEFASYVNQALNELDKGIEVMHEYTCQISGNLKIGSINTVSGNYLPELIEAYHKEVSGTVTFDINQGFSLPLLEELEDDKYDLVFSARCEKYSNLAFVPILAQRFVALMHSDHPLATKQSIQLDELLKFPILTYRKGTPIGNHVQKALGNRTGNVSYSYDDEITMAGMLSTDEANRTCAIIADTINLRSFNNLVILPFNENDIPLDMHKIYLVYKKTEFKNRATESFLEYTKQFVPEESNEIISLVANKE